MGKMVTTYPDLNDCDTSLTFTTLLVTPNRKLSYKGEDPLTWTPWRGRTPLIDALKREDSPTVSLKREDSPHRCLVLEPVCTIQNNTSSAGGDWGVAGTSKLSLNWKAIWSLCLQVTHLIVPQIWQSLWCHWGHFHQIVDVNMEVIIKLDELDRRFGVYLVDDHASPFQPSS